MNKAKVKASALGLADAIASGTVDGPEVEVLPPEGQTTKPPRKNARAAGKDPKGRQLVGSARKQSPFLTAVDKYGGLTADDKRLIRDVWTQGLSLQDVQAAWLFNWLSVQKAVSSGALPPQVAQAALNQLTNSAVRLAELVVAQGQALPDAIKIIMDISTAKAPAGDLTPPPGPNGDVLEVE